MSDLWSLRLEHDTGRPQDDNPDSNCNLRDW